MNAIAAILGRTQADFHGEPCAHEIRFFTTLFCDSVLLFLDVLSVGYKIGTKGR
jgi:hypothetical protein